MPNITMRHNTSGSRVFRIRVTVNGQVYQTTYPGKTESPIPVSWSDKRAMTAAQKAAALFEDECRRGLATNDRRTLSQYAHTVLDLKATTGALKPSTIDGYRRLLARIDGSKLASIRLRDLTVRDLNAFYAELSGEGANLQTSGTLSAKTVREYHAFISSVLHQAAREQVLPYNPAVNATLPKVVHKEANYYTAERMAEILAAVKQEPVFWQAVTGILVGTGARRGEVLGLQWTDVDFEQCRIFIRRSVTRASGDGTVHIGTTKTGKDRVISIAPAFLKPLREWRAEQARFAGTLNVSYCFALDDPTLPIKPDTVTRYYARLGEKYNLGHVNPHAYRHSQASILLQDGDIVSASKRLGHSQTSTTLNLYGHMMPETDRAAADRVGDAFLTETWTR